MKTTIKVDTRTRDVINKAKYKAGAKNVDQLLYNLIKLLYRFKLWEELNALMKLK